MVEGESQLQESSEEDASRFRLPTTPEGMRAMREQLRAMGADIPEPVSRSERPQGEVRADDLPTTESRAVGSPEANHATYGVENEAERINVPAKVLEGGIEAERQKQEALRAIKEHIDELFPE